MTTPVSGVCTVDNFCFDNGATLSLEISYWTLGTLNEQKSNAIVVCHGASGNRDWALPFARPEGAFDTNSWFVISIDLPGGGGSSRASMTTGFPDRYCIRDLTRAVAALVRGLGLSRIAAFSGASLASLLGVDLAASHPELVGGLALWNCGVRCDGYAGAVVTAICSCLVLDGGRAGTTAAVTAFLPSLLGRAAVAKMDRVAQTTFVDHIASSWSEDWTVKEIIARYSCVAESDLPTLYGGEAALAARLTCPILWLPSSSDMILPAIGIAEFARAVPSARFRICETDNGHVSTSAAAGSTEFAFYDDHTGEFLRGLRT